MTTTPARQVRAVYDADTITVYQAYAPPIAEAAVAAQAFVPPFKNDRMTWIKPSFLWMMYRCGWATKRDQERVLAIRVERSFFDRCLANASLSHYDADMYASHAEWSERKKRTHVRVQWDPERDIRLSPLPWRSIQIGIGGPYVRDYARTAIRSIDDITDAVRKIRQLVAESDLASAKSLLPPELPYELPPEAAAAVGAS
jgi:hypothetical protein